MFVRLSPTAGLEPDQISLGKRHIRFSRTLHQLGAESGMMDRLNKRVHVIKDLLEGGKIIVYGPCQRVPKECVPKSLPVCRRNDASLSNVAEYGEERRF